MTQQTHHKNPSNSNLAGKFTTLVAMSLNRGCSLQTIKVNSEDLRHCAVALLLTGSKRFDSKLVT